MALALNTNHPLYPYLTALIAVDTDGVVKDLKNPSRIITAAPQVTYPASYGYGRGFRVSKNGNYNTYGLTLSPGITVNQSTGNTLVFAAMNNFVSGSDGTWAKGEFVGSNVPFFHLHNSGEIRPLFNWPGTIAKVPVSTIASPVPFTIAQTRTGSATANIKYWINGVSAPLQNPGSNYGQGLGGTVTQISSNDGEGGIAADYVFLAFFDGKTFTDQEIAGLHSSLTGGNAFSLVSESTSPVLLTGSSSTITGKSVGGSVDVVVPGGELSANPVSQLQAGVAGAISAIPTNSLQIGNNAGHPESAVNFSSVGHSLVVGNNAAAPGSSISLVSDPVLLSAAPVASPINSVAGEVLSANPAPLSALPSSCSHNSTAGSMAAGTVYALGSLVSNQVCQSLAGGVLSADRGQQTGGYYCSRADMVMRFGRIELVHRTDRENNQDINDDVLQAAIVDAHNEIDSYLGRYVLPLPVVPPVLNRIACDIARYRLYDDQVIEVVKDRYKDAINFLMAISRGTAELPLAVENNTGNFEAEMVMLSVTPVFSRDY